MACQTQMNKAIQLEELTIQKDPESHAFFSPALVFLLFLRVEIDYCFALPFCNLITIVILNLTSLVKKDALQVQHTHTNLQH